ncbi:MAG: PASTA domain-containing protein [Candidatus Aminicenantes bacterium]|nr:PASTA domain-containing protein [Candidatus Aminicenantes bacterium]
MVNDRLFNGILYPLLFLNVFFLCALVASRLFLRGETIAVPDVVGKTYAEAGEELGRKKISLQIRDRQFDDLLPKGAIVSQSPPPGSRIQILRPVRVVLSRGSEEVVVPRLINRSLEAVTPELRAMGLAKGRVSFIHTARYPAGRIMAQSPPAETPVQRDSAVDMLVSQGALEEKYVMPDLLGRPAESVRRQLASQGFNLTYSGSSYYPGLESGTIIRQTPPKGHAVHKRTIISVEVSR